jgi:hypothetical protein
MKKFSIMIVFGLFMIFAKNSAAELFNLPVQVDYGLIKKALSTQLYTGQGHTAEVWHDKHQCSYLKLSDPQISGQQGNIRLLNNVQAQFGTEFGGQCVTVLQWKGVLETLQQPTLNADGSILSLPVTKATAYDQQHRQLTVDKLQDLIKRFVEPRLSAIKIDLNESRTDIEHTLSSFLAKEARADMNSLLNTLKFSHAAANDDGVAVELSFDATPKLTGAKPAAAFSEAEQKQWQAAWQEWDVFLSKTIQQAADDAHSPALRDTLTAVLVDARRAFQAGLKAQGAKAEDPVRAFFITTWKRLAPELQTLAKQLPEAEALRYLTFIAATDIIYQLDTMGAPLGLDISSDGLRKLARLLMAGKQQQADARYSQSTIK